MSQKDRLLQIDETALNVVNVGIIILDSNSHVVQWNHWMERYSGFDKDFVLGRTIKSIFPSIENIRLFSAISQAVDSGSSAILAQSIHHSPLPLFCETKKEKIQQAIEIKPLKVTSDKGFYCLIQVSNVDSAVRREGQLRKNTLELSQLLRDLSNSESRTKAIVDISGDGVVVINDEGLIQSLNSRAEEIFACTQEDILNEDVSQFFSAAYAEQVPAFIRKFARHGGLMQAGTWRMMEAMRRDGEIFPINLNLTTAKLGDKNQIIGIVRDLSELEESERALQESNDSLQMALNCGDLWMWDLSVETGTVNQEQMMLRLGYEKDSYENDLLAWRQLVHPEDFIGVNEEVQQHIDGKTSSFCSEYRLLKADGEWLWVHDQGRAVARDHQGKALRMIGINQNINRRKLAEIEAKKATEKALEAARVKSDFLGNMSHELRTPMNGVMGVLNLLQHTEPTDEQAEYIDVAKRSAQSLLKMIDSVLDFSKLGAKSVELELISFDPEEILKDVVKLLSESASEKSVSLAYFIEGYALNNLMTDPGRLRQVLLNLIGNAIKFTDEGHVQVHLLNTDSGQYLFEVRDTGIGIAEERIDIIFDAFAQGDVSITRKFGGTGLGLGISKELVELMGGKIMVESEVDRGSVFSFTIENHNQENVELHADKVEFI